MYLFGELWNRWTLAFKVTTPCLHVLFASAQLWGSYSFYKLYKKQEKLIERLDGHSGDEEVGDRGVVRKEDGDQEKKGPEQVSQDSSEVELQRNSL